MIHSIPLFHHCIIPSEANNILHKLNLNTMKRRTIALYLRSYDYEGLIIFAKRIYDGMQRNIALFPSPVPTLAVFLATLNEMQSWLDKHGSRKNHGSATDFLELRRQREILIQYLKAYASYVMVMQPDEPQIWLEVGFALKALPAKNNTLEAPQDLHQFIARNIVDGDIKLKWLRPLNVPAGSHITYLVFRSEDTDFSHAAVIATVVRKAVYVDRPPKAGVIYYYWVVPVTSAGQGVRSEMCTAYASPVAA